MDVPPRALYACRRSPQPGTQAYAQGQKQAEYNDEQYHYLCAAIQAKYRLLDNIRSSAPGALFPRQGLTFSLYTARSLPDVLGVKLHPREDGTVHEGDLKVYHDSWARDWKHVQGGILYTIGSDQRGFWNVVLNYCSSAGTTGDKKWDALFKKLKENGYRKDTIPCAFFNKESGCTNASCPFQHDKAQANRLRAQVLSRRRKTMSEPTPKQRMQYLRAKQGWERGGTQPPRVPLPDFDPFEDEEGDDEEMVPNPLFDPNTKRFCSNPECNLAWLRDDESGEKPLMKCAKCKWALYCSKECQVADWKRHKKEPCAPVEEIIVNDDLWEEDTRKGTGLFGQ